jgi:hypothetical protein
MGYLGRSPTPSPIDTSDIPANSIDASKIIDGSIELAEIADNSITDAKLNSSKLDGIETGATNYIHPTTHATADIADNAITDAKLNSSKLDDIETGATADQTKADIEGLGIAASSITGALPAIDGGALTGNVGKVLQVQRLISDSFDVSISAVGEYSILSKTITVSEGSKLLIFAESGQIQMNSFAQNNPSIGISVDSTIVIDRDHTNHAWYNVLRNNDARTFINTTGMTGALTAGSHTIEIIAGIQTNGETIVYGYQGGGGNRRANVVVWEIAQ